MGQESVSTVVSAMLQGCGGATASTVVSAMCKECGGSVICEHGRERRRCKECGSNK